MNRNLLQNRVLWAIAAGMLAAVAYLAFPTALRELLYHRTEKALAEATPQEARISAGFLFDRYPEEIEAARLYLRASRRADSLPSEEDRSQIIQRFGQEDPNVITWIALAEFQNGLLANALGTLSASEDALNTLEGLRLATVIAETQQNRDDAVRYASRLLDRPDLDLGDQLLAGQVLVASSVPGERQRAVSALMDLNGTPCGFAANLELAQRAINSEELEFAIEGLVQSEPQSSLQHFQRLDLLASIDHADLAECLAIAQRELVRVDDVARLVGWMNAQGESPSAIEWASELPVPILQQSVVRMAIAESYLYQGDRRGLFRHLNQGVWPRDESIRLALISLCLDDEDYQQEFWNRAVSAAATESNTPRLLEVLETWGIDHPPIES
ncbi:MAG: hypothetical protein AAFX93_02365 [Verrucomicrobiota bacterium]